MTQSFDEFKKYHNANHHDGSSHFDEQIYKKSNGDDFDCSFVQDCYDHFEAGQQSRQAEIDAALKQRDSFIKAHHIAMNDVCDLRAEIDELQKRIDVCEKLRDSQFDKLWNLTQAIETARDVQMRILTYF